MIGPALLFCPADRPERFAKAAAAADTVIIDLEDAVAPADKAAARAALVATPLDPARTIVRVNPAGTAAHAADIEALRSTEYSMVMLAKTESATQIDAVAEFAVFALCETALGVVRAMEIAQHRSVAGMMWGAEDLIASLDGRSSRLPDGRYRDVARHARSTVLLAARAFGRLPIDAVHLDIPDLDGLRQAAVDGAESGFAATACIHPSQVDVVRAAYAASLDDRAWAQAVLAEAEQQPGVFRFRGLMVDEPVLRQARRMLET